MTTPCMALSTLRTTSTATIASWSGRYMLVIKGSDPYVPHHH